LAKIPHEFLGSPSVWYVDPNFPRAVWFQIEGDIYSNYTLKYTFSEDVQRLELSKGSLQGEGDADRYVRTEVLSLTSRRFEGQKSNPSAQINYLRYPAKGDNELRCESTPSALQKAREMLAGLSPQSSEIISFPFLYLQFISSNYRTVDLHSQQCLI